MGIYDRDYYRNEDSGDWGIGITPAVKFLIIANVVVFLLQIFFVRPASPLEFMRKFDPVLDRLLAERDASDEEAAAKIKKTYGPLLDAEGIGAVQDARFQISIVQEWCELDTNAVVKRGQIWRLVTHAFCHDRFGLWHIFFNMLALFWFGCTMEIMVGRREFLLFYFASIVAAAAAFIALDLYTGYRVPAVGASGAVMAVMMLYTYNFPRTVLYIFWVIPVEMRFVMAAYVLWDLHPVLLALSGDRMFTGIAHAAHLGGLAFGFAYAKFHWRLENMVDRLTERWSWPRWQQRLAIRSRPRLRIAPETVPDRNAENDKIDAILEKIMESGRSSLTEDEREVLRLASERLKKEQGRS